MLWGTAPQLVGQLLTRFRASLRLLFTLFCCSICFYLHGRHTFRWEAFLGFASLTYSCTHLLINLKPCLPSSSLLLIFLFLHLPWPINAITTTREWPDMRHHTLSNGNHATTPVREQVKAPDGEGCPRCGVSVYAAEQMLGREKVKKALPTW